MVLQKLKNYSKVHLQIQSSYNSQSNFDCIKDNVGGLTVFYFDNYYKATKFKIAWYWLQDRQTDQ